ncbi:hypothetical protein F5148DRAFT_86391 [Russula earlei]|uniref:Uncharacterized protein n=1 Tax=Russula earlei TaxID=71964 RepID=A0ACC0U8S6_9AGAM|nr:hypothetical protein F5148DRAFT_86391 [Russula earlei]
MVMAFAAILKQLSPLLLLFSHQVSVPSPNLPVERFRFHGDGQSLDSMQTSLSLDKCTYSDFLSSYSDVRCCVCKRQAWSNRGVVKTPRQSNDSYREVPLSLTWLSPGNSEEEHCLGRSCEACISLNCPDSRTAAHYDVERGYSPKSGPSPQTREPLPRPVRNTTWWRDMNNDHSTSTAWGRDRSFAVISARFSRWRRKGVDMDSMMERHWCRQKGEEGPTIFCAIVRL